MKKKLLCGLIFLMLAFSVNLFAAVKYYTGTIIDGDCVYTYYAAVNNNHGTATIIGSPDCGGIFTVSWRVAGDGGLEPVVLEMKQ